VNRKGGGGPAPTIQSVRVRVPATSANLGPGFDALGLALDLHDEVIVTLLPGTEIVIDIAGIGAETLPRDESHLLLSSLRTAAQRFGVELSGIGIAARNAIPQSRGLGSSAATITAGVAAAWMLASGHDQLDRAEVLGLAAQIEGHPDNVAACVLGGLTISWQGARGAQAVAVPIRADIEPVLFLPPDGLSTDTARGLLPATIGHAEAAFNAGRSALLIHALTAAPELLLVATQDRLHQSQRGPAMPESSRLLEALRAADIPAVISGAGPSVLALCSTACPPERASAVPMPAGWTCLRLEVSAGADASLVGAPPE